MTINICALILTVTAVCLRIATAVRTLAAQFQVQGPSPGLISGASNRVNAGFPTGIGSILITPKLRPGNESRKTVLHQRIRGDPPSLSAGCTRPALDPKMCLPKNRRKTQGLANRLGCFPAPHPEIGPRRSLCITARFLKMEGARLFSLGPESGRKFVCYDTGPPWPRRPSGLLAETEGRVQKQRCKLKQDSNRFPRFKPGCIPGAWLPREEGWQ
jgi:hypothetical protein